MIETIINDEMTHPNNTVRQKLLFKNSITSMLDNYQKDEKHNKTKIHNMIRTINSYLFKLRWRNPIYHQLNYSFIEKLSIDEELNSVDVQYSIADKILNFDWEFYPVNVSIHSRNLLHGYVLYEHHSSPQGPQVAWNLVEIIDAYTSNTYQRHGCHPNTHLVLLKVKIRQTQEEFRIEEIQRSLFANVQGTFVNLTRNEF